MGIGRFPRDEKMDDGLKRFWEMVGLSVDVSGRLTDISASRQTAEYVMFDVGSYVGTVCIAGTCIHTYSVN